MDSKAVQHAAKLIAIHTERAIIRRELSKLTPAAIEIRFAIPDAALNELFAASDRVPADSHFTPSVSISNFVHNSLMAQLTTEIESIERELTSMGVQLAFLADPDDAVAHLSTDELTKQVGNEIRVEELEARLEKLMRTGSSSDLMDAANKLEQAREAALKRAILEKEKFTDKEDAYLAEAQKLVNGMRDGKILPQAMREH